MINQIYCEDCLETMSRMPDNFVDLTVTSPPYDNLRDYNGFSFDFAPIAKELFRVTKEGGVVVWVVNDATINGSETGTSFRQALFFMECGFKLHDTMIYQNDRMPLNNNRYEPKFDFMFVLVKGKLKTFNPILEETKYNGQVNRYDTGEKHKAKFDKKAKRYVEGKVYTIKEKKIKGNVWYIPSGWCKTSTDKIAFNHPAIFPEKLARDHILSWSNKGDLIYDPFMGSGTTAKMATLNDRNYIGSEISSEYCGISNKRIKDANKQVRIEF